MPYFVVIRERSTAWDWSVPMREQAGWAAHAAFMDSLATNGFIAAGGPLGSEDGAKRIMHVVHVHEECLPERIEATMAQDPWTPMHLLETVSIEPWTVLLGGFDCRECGGSLLRQEAVE